jgi:predicted AAA+ superfamily ATPase
LESLKDWKNSPDRKPLVLWGARQVGKTWLMREFGRTEFDNMLYLNFDTQKSLAEMFESDIHPARIISQLEKAFNIKIDMKSTLLIFDEIQECQRAKDSLKYFNESAPEYHIIAAGSFLGVSGGKFPVGQVNSLTLYPLSFYEFLEAQGRSDLVEALKKRDETLLSGINNLFIDQLKNYFYVGGMPAAVSEFIAGGDLDKIRMIQNEILTNYKGDFSKHIAPKDIPKVRMLWDSIPAHLAKEKKKFVYKDVKSGGRAAEFENAMDWLINTGLVYKIPKADTPKIPLIAYQSPSNFKLYSLDIGLLGAQSEVSQKDIFLPDVDLTNDFNGMLAEQFACQELKAADISPLFYWARDGAMAEIDFITQHDGEVIPIEIKSASNTKSKSLQSFINDFHPKHAVKSSLNNYNVGNGVYAIPLYRISDFYEIIGNAAD